VKMGVQTVSERTLKNVLHRRGSPGKVQRAAELLERHGIKLTVEHIIGFPGEGRREQEEAARFYAGIKTKKIISFWLTYFPGTEIVEVSRRFGLLSDVEARAIEAGDPDMNYTFMFPKGADSGADRRLMNFHILYDLLPMLPRGLRNFFIERVGLMRYSAALHQLLIIINAFRNRDREDILGMKYVLARKDVP